MEHSKHENLAKCGLHLKSGSEGHEAAGKQQACRLEHSGEANFHKGVGDARLHDWI